MNEIDRSLVRDGLAAIGERENKDHLAEFMSSAPAVKYFGAAWALKADTLAALINQSSLLDVARKHGVCNEAVYKHARIARLLFAQLIVDSAA